MSSYIVPPRGFRLRAGILVPLEAESDDEYDIRMGFRPIKPPPKPPEPENPTPEIELKDPVAERIYNDRACRFASPSPRPARREDVVGQDDALGQLEALLSNPEPCHVLLVGPPGTGKTTAARIALQMAKKVPGPHSPRTLRSSRSTEPRCRPTRTTPSTDCRRW